jgi:hypothetical protein
MQLIRLTRGFARLGPHDRVGLLVAWVLLGITRLLIIVLPFPALRVLLGEHNAASPGNPVLPAERHIAARIGGIVRLAARHTPWKSECYPQALTARVFLVASRIPHVVSFGVRRENDQLLAHAWVHTDGTPITGGIPHDYTEVASFTWVPAGPHRWRNRAHVRRLRPDAPKRDRAS